ncbi:MAG: glutamate-1-semialdehyde 2,1-aminomutase [Verrucomicrobiae bacterium]|nr:glutamate-1-semialdehyde 2,1-aminomutase [Verrucomicrobiae bacterium]
MNPSRAYSEKLWQEALALFPGGVNSPVRAFCAVGGTPFFTQRARGAHLWDVDGNEYVDYVMSWGPMIHGHAYPRVIQAVMDAARDGTSFGTPNPREIHLARLIQRAMPSLEKIRFVNSGTEATMSAIRLARGFTGRDTIVKFAGCYHGHVDSLLVKAGSGAATFDIPDSAGVPADFARHTLTLPLNDITALHRVPWNQVAAAIIEPIPANMGLIPLQPEFLGTLRALTRDHGALLIFDEVMSGFRVAPGGAQQLYGIQPDLTTLGKIIGGGLPVGAFGGRREIMDQLAPTGPVYQAGTLSGNPLAMAAGIATLEPLLDPPAAPDAPTPYQRLEQISAALLDELRKFLPAQCVRVGSMFCCFFTKQPVVDDRTARTCDTTRYARFFHAMLRRGVYLAPSQFEVGFLSLAHTPDDIEHTVRAARDAVKEL